MICIKSLCFLYYSQYENVVVCADINPTCIPGGIINSIRRSLTNVRNHEIVNTNFFRITLQPKFSSTILVESHQTKIH